MDVLVDARSESFASGYVKRNICVFQVKAEKFSASKIKEEMAPHGHLRSAIEVLAKTKGAYVIASTRDDLSHISRENRLTAMRSCLSSRGLDKYIDIDFYDCRKIADWTEQHPAITSWLWQALRKPSSGWQAYGPWAYQEKDVSSEYILDDRVRFFAAEEQQGVDAQAAINRLRGDLRNNASIRIVGLSGVGKTRLVQALFDARIQTEHPHLDAENVLYTDLAHNPDPPPRTLLSHLVQEGVDSVVVVDNCGAELHGRLTEVIKKSNGDLRLITIEYDIRDHYPDDTLCYRLESATNDLIRALLKSRKFPLSKSDLDRICSLSDGNARVALALAYGVGRSGEVTKLSDADLFDRLFLQRNSDDNQLRRCAEISSLLYSFDGEDVSPLSEIALLASLADASTTAFVRAISTLRKRGLVQERGVWRAVLPHAIANRLAIEALELIPESLLIKSLLNEQRPRVSLSFARRLGLLHQSPTAVRIAGGLLDAQGAYGDLQRLDSKAWQVVENLAPANPKAALQWLGRTIRSSTFYQTPKIERTELARLLRSIAYEAAYFNDAISELIHLANNEPDYRNRVSIQDILKSLFWVTLSGTEASAFQRSEVVRMQLESDSSEVRSLGLMLLEATLKTSHFSSSRGFDFGLRRRSYGWHPRTEEDIAEWYAPFIRIAIKVGLQDNLNGRAAREVLGRSLRGLWAHAKLHDLVSAAAKEFGHIGWVDGWLGIRRVLLWDKDKIPKTSLDLLLQLERMLAPKDLKSRILGKVLSAGATDELDYENLGSDPVVDSASERYSKSLRTAEDLGRLTAHEEGLAEALLPELLTSSNAKIYHYGRGVGQESENQSELLNLCRTLILEATEQKNLAFVVGLIAGWNKRNYDQVSDFLDTALYDEVWSANFPRLQAEARFDDRAYQRVVDAISKSRAPIGQFASLGTPEILRCFKQEQLAKFIELLAETGRDGSCAAINVLSRAVHFGTTQNSDSYLDEVVKILRAFIKDLDWSFILGPEDHAIYQLSELVDFLMRRSFSEDDATQTLVKLAKVFVDAERELSYGATYDYQRILLPFFRFFPLATLDVVYQVARSSRYGMVYQTILGVEDDPADQQDVPIQQVPLDTLIEWCSGGDDNRFLFAANICRLFGVPASANEPSIRRLMLSESVSAILKNVKNKKEAIQTILQRLIPGVWSGNIVTVQERLPLLSDLVALDSYSFKSEIDEMRVYVERKIKEVEAQDQAEDRQNNTFE